VAVAGVGGGSTSISGGVNGSGGGAMRRLAAMPAGSHPAAGGANGRLRNQRNKAAAACGGVAKMWQPMAIMA